MSKQRKITYFMILIAIFSALTFGATYIAIPLGVSKVHLGNFVSIIASLLCGGWVGGISGALGMGLNDIALGYGPSTVIRTFIVKFLVGFITGILFRYFIKNKKNVNFIYLFLIGLFALVFTIFLVLYILYGSEFTIGERTFKNSLLLVISLGVISLFFLFAYIFSHKISKIQQYVALSTSIGMVINIVSEFVLKIPLKVLFDGYNFTQAFVYATTSLPSALITAIVTIIFITLIYVPVYYASKNINKLNDIGTYIEDITTWDKK